MAAHFGEHQVTHLWHIFVLFLAIRCHAVVRAVRGRSHDARREERVSGLVASGASTSATRKQRIAFYFRMMLKNSSRTSKASMADKKFPVITGMSASSK